MEKQRTGRLFGWNEQDGELLKWVKQNVTRDNVNDQVFLYQRWLKYNDPTGVYTSNSAWWSMLHYSRGCAPLDPRSLRRFAPQGALLY
jgi:hypothetical protein